MMRWVFAAAMVMITPPAAFAQNISMPSEPLINAEKLKLLERDTPVSARDIYPEDPEAKIKAMFDCGDLEGVNRYMSSLYRRQELHYAAVHGDDLRVRQLLLEGADINARDAMGATPLLLAAKNGALEMVRLLMEAGADPAIEDNMGYTGFDYAVMYVWPEVEDMLRSWPGSRKRLMVGQGAEGGAQ